MSRIELMGGNVQVYRRGDGKRWHCSASIDGTQHRISSKMERLDQAKAFAEDWYLTLQGKHRAGVLDTGPTFKKTAEGIRCYHRWAAQPEMDGRP